MKNIKIRRATKEDVLNLSVLKKQVFISTYAIDGIRKDFSEYITSEFSEENLQENLKDENRIVLVAEQNDFLIGCAEIEINNRCNETKDNSPELTVLYVFEHAKGKGIGYRLITECESIVKRLNYPGLWLTVYHQNFNAIQFYNRQQYKDIGQWFFEMGGEKHENRIMFKRF